MRSFGDQEDERPTVTPSERIARKTLALMPPPEPANEAQGDVVLTVTVIILIVKLCMLAWQCWEDGGKAKSICMRPNPIQRWYLRRIVKKALKAHGLADQTGKVTAALLRIAAACTVEDVEAVFKEAQADPEIWSTARSLGLI